MVLRILSLCGKNPIVFFVKALYPHQCSAGANLYAKISLLLSLVKVLATTRCSKWVENVRYGHYSNALFWINTLPQYLYFCANVFEVFLTKMVQEIMTTVRLHFSARKRRWCVFNHAFSEIFPNAISRYSWQVFEMGECCEISLP